MGMFVVEDGSGVVGATSYASTQAADEYATFWGKQTWLDLDEIDKQHALIRATSFLETEISWGSRILTKEQGLSWPRIPFKDLDGRDVEGLPKVVVEATIQIAIASLNYDIYSSPKVLVSQAYATTRESYLGGYIEDPSPEFQAIKIALRKLAALGIGGKRMKQVTLQRG